MQYATVALLNNTDSTLVIGTLTDELGDFILKDIKTGNYLLLISYLGYMNHYHTLEVLTSEITDIDIVLNEEGILLQNATIIAKRPFLEQMSDRLVVNVANSAIAAGGTVLEILQKVPGVVVLQDKVTLGGSQRAQIYVDGKPSNFGSVSSVLRDIPGDQIDKIEVINQPGAQFDASGGPIINIVLKRNASIGTKTTLGFTASGYQVNQNDVDFGKKNYLRYNPNINLTHRNKKLNFYGNISFNKGNYFDVIKVKRWIANEIFNSQNLDEVNNNFLNSRFGVDYFLNKKVTIGSVVRLWGTNNNGLNQGKTEILAENDNSLLDNFTSLNSLQSIRRGKYVSFYTKYEFNNDKILDIDIDLTTYDTKSINDISIVSAENKISRSRQDVEQPINILVAKIDYKVKLDSAFQIETGIKSSFSDINNDLKFYRSEILSLFESNDFNYIERINAGYVNVKRSKNNIEFNAGLRVEHSNLQGKSLNITQFSNTYFQFFPSVNVLYSLNQQISLQSSYSKRVNRPNFSQQNPFTYFIDSLTYMRGNPKLRPEIINSIQLKLNFNDQPFFGVSYLSISDVIIQNAPRLEGNKTFATVENLANQKKLEFQLNFPLKVGKIIDGYGGNQVIYNSYDAVFDNLEYKVSRWHWLAYWQINSTIKNNIKVELGGYYMTKFLEEFVTIDDLLGVNIGISKPIFNDNGRISLSWNDIFYSQKIESEINFGDLDVQYFQRYSSQYLKLNFTYTFGNNTIKAYNMRKEASENESSRIK